MQEEFWWNVHRIDVVMPLTEFMFSAVEYYSNTTVEANNGDTWWGCLIQAVLAAFLTHGFVYLMIIFCVFLDNIYLNRLRATACLHPFRLILALLVHSLLTMFHRLCRILRLCYSVYTSNGGYQINVAYLLDSSTRFQLVAVGTVIKIYSNTPHTED